MRLSLNRDITLPFYSFADLATSYLIFSRVIMPLFMIGGAHWMGGSLKEDVHTSVRPKALKSLVRAMRFSVAGDNHTFLFVQEFVNWGEECVCNDHF